MIASAAAGARLEPVTLPEAWNTPPAQVERAVAAHAQRQGTGERHAAGQQGKAVVLERKPR